MSLFLKRETNITSSVFIIPTATLKLYSSILEIALTEGAPVS